MRNVFVLDFEWFKFDWQYLKSPNMESLVNN